MKFWAGLLFSLLLACQAAFAAGSAVRSTILYVPMDNRPVCLDYTVATMQAAGWDVLTPPAEYLADEERSGDADKLFAWLEENARRSVAVVASSDALLYGGLVASRTHEIPFETLKARAERLIKLKNTHGGQRVYVFTTIMRSPKASAAPVEPAYYAEWGPKIFRMGALEDKLELKKIKRREVKELADLRSTIPQAVREDMYTRRANNIRATELLLHGVESGDFDYMLIGRDDTAAFSQAHREARSMDILVHELPKERIRFFAGADQLGLLLLSRASTRLQYNYPLVNVTYAAGKGGETVPSYEDDTVAESVKQHIYAAGAFPAKLRKYADIVLAVNTPENGVTLESSNAANNYKLSAATGNFTKKIARLLKNGHKVAVADIKYGNGADNSFVTDLFANGLAYKLAAYSGWNTAGNSIGYALAQGLLDDRYAPGTQEELLTVRYLDDWAYQANVRDNTFRNLIWPNYWPNSGLKDEKLKGAEEYIAREIKKVAGEKIGAEIDNYTIRLPWKRMFEIGVTKSDA